MNSSTLAYKLRKLKFYALEFGFFWTLAKLCFAYKIRVPFYLLLYRPWRLRSKHTVGFVGCGGHSYTTLALFIRLKTDANFVFALDTNSDAANFFSKAYAIKHTCSDLNDLEKLRIRADVVYIASSHSTHAFYADHFSARGAKVYCEKPLALTEDDYLSFQKMQAEGRRIYSGYNRPHAPFIKYLSENVLKKNGREVFSMSCIVKGHKLSEDHWYRSAGEGSRVASNMCHWLDLFYYIYCNVTGNSTGRFRIDLAFNEAISFPTDNMAITVSSERGDLFNLCFTSRNEPFEGVAEYIFFETSRHSVVLENFKRMRITQGFRRTKVSVFRRDRGHEMSVLQPFFSDHSGVSDSWLGSAKLIVKADAMLMTQQRTGSVEI